MLGLSQAWKKQVELLFKYVNTKNLINESYG